MGEQLPLFGAAAPPDPYADVFEAIDQASGLCPVCKGGPRVTLVVAPPQWPNLVLAEVACTVRTCKRCPVLMDLKVEEREHWTRQILECWRARCCAVCGYETTIEPCPNCEESKEMCAKGGSDDN